MSEDQGTNVVPFIGGGTLASPDQLKGALQNFRQDRPVSPGDRPLIKLLKSGYWVYGVDQIDVQEQSLWAANPQSISHGWVAWGEGELLGQEMVPFNQSLPQKDKLPPSAAKRGWEFQVGIDFMCISGEDQGQEVQYLTSSTGGKRAHDKLIKAILAHLDEDPATPVPVLELEVDSYTHKQYGEIFVPILTVKRWMGMEGPDAGTAQASAPEPEAETPAEAPKRRRRGRPAAAEAAGSEAPAQAAEAAKSPETNDSAPRRRRRRRAAE